MQRSEPNHYATLGLDPQCTVEQIRAAFRLLAKQLHPDLNPGSEAQSRTQALNAAYEVLSDPERRRDFDESRRAPKLPRTFSPGGKIVRDVTEEVHLRPEEFLRGTTLNICVNDPGNPDGRENYELIVPPETAPGARFGIPRATGGRVLVRVRARADFRFKIRGSDLRCDLRITPQRAAQGGAEMVQGLSGRLSVKIPRGVARGEILRLEGEGLPKARGGRGDLLMRVSYRPEVKIVRSRHR